MRRCIRKTARIQEKGKSFDAIILDPPAFCKTAADIKNACKGYRDININAMKSVTPGGYLFTSSCSHYMSFTLFENMLKEAAAASGRTVKCLEVRTQSADHPSLLAADETLYLKFFILQIM